VPCDEFYFGVHGEESALDWHVWRRRRRRRRREV
jgi:hypothetical protein